MSFLRLGTSCVVVDDEGRVLLSQRGDLGTWVLPGGRLDRGERLADAALREVREETGIVAELIRLAGLVYVTRWRRMNVLFLARATGGTLSGRTRETRDNRFFPVDSFPSRAQHEDRARAVLNGDILLETVETPIHDYRRLRRRFAVRWVENLLRGRPEPRYPRFIVRATCVTGNNQLLSVRCDGSQAPWQALAARLGITAPLRWIGVGEAVDAGAIDFVFATNATAHQMSGSLSADHHEYIKRAREDGPVWSIPLRQSGG